MIKDEQNSQPGRYDLFVLTQAYNRGELSLEEWIARTRAGAEAVITRCQSQPKGERPAWLPG